MAEGAGREISKAIERYNPFLDDYNTSRELLEQVQQSNRQALDSSGFTTHFIDALHDVPYVAPNAQVLVSQKEDGEFRKIWAVLRQQSPQGNNDSHSRLVGEEFEGMQLAAKPFTSEDLELAISQLNDLCQMKALGMLSIDRSLSFPEFPPTWLFRA